MLGSTPDRTRTCDPLLRRQLLYPLSYWGRVIIQFYFTLRLTANWPDYILGRKTLLLVMNMTHNNVGYGPVGQLKTLVTSALS
jgi:hypothetical protein